MNGVHGPYTVAPARWDPVFPSVLLPAFELDSTPNNDIPSRLHLSHFLFTCSCFVCHPHKYIVNTTTMSPSRRLTRDASRRAATVVADRKRDPRRIKSARPPQPPTTSTPAAVASAKIRMRMRTKTEKTDNQQARAWNPATNPTSGQIWFSPCCGSKAPRMHERRDDFRRIFCARSTATGSFFYCPPFTNKTVPTVRTMVA